MKLLQPAHQKAFMRDFHGGFDGLLRHIALPVRTFGQDSMIELILSLPDRDQSDAWTDLRLRVYGIETFAVRGDLRALQVLSSGFAFDWFNTDEFNRRLHLSLDLDPNENPSRAAYLASGFLVIGQRAYWDRLPYAETHPSPEAEPWVDAEAVVIECDATKEGVGEGADWDDLFHYWIYDYESVAPGSDRTMKHQGKIQFVGSVRANWLAKYPPGFRFPVRYNRTDPAHHLRLHEFD